VRKLDLNADVGESFGHWRYEYAERVIAQLTTAHIACGWHAGDPTVMREVMFWCRAHAVVPAAHPGFPDLQGFGRRFMDVTLEEAYDMIVYQVGALKAFARLAELPLRIASSHGAFSAWENQSDAHAECMVQALKDALGEDLVMYLPPTPYEPLLASAARAGIRVVPEFYPGLVYDDAGEPMFGRSFEESGDVRRTLAIVERWLDSGMVDTSSGGDVLVEAEAIRFHGDVATAPDVLAGIRGLCAHRGIAVENIAFN